MPRPSRRQTSAKIRLENQEKNNPGSGVYLKGSKYTRRADSGTDSEWVESGSDVDHEDTEPESDDAEYDEDDDMDPVQVFLLRLQHEEANPTPTKHWQGNGNSKRNKRRRRQQERQKEARGKDPEWRRKNPAITSFFQPSLPACEEKHDTGDSSDGDLTTCSANWSCSDGDDGQ